MLQHLFSSVFTHDNGVIHPIHCFADVTFTYDDVFRVIVNLEYKNIIVLVGGPDGFHLFFLKLLLRVFYSHKF